MADFLSFLMQGQTPPVTSSTTSQSSSLPLWYQQALQGVSNAAISVAGEPFKGYTGPRVAGFDPMQQQSFDYTGANATSWSPLMASATSTLNRGSQGFDAGAGGLGMYMNPYQSQVTDEIKRQGLKMWNQDLLPGINDQFTGSGQFGSRRHEDAVMRGANDLTANITGQQALSNAQGFDTSMKNYGDWTNRAITAGGALSQLAQQQLGLTAGTAGLLESAGRTQQQQEQANLDVGYSDFLEQRGFPASQISYVSNILRGLPTSSTATQTSSAPYSGSMGPSPLATMAGIYSLGRGVTARTGGRIRDRMRYADGGRVPMRRMSRPQVMRSHAGLAMLRGM